MAEENSVWRNSTWLFFSRLMAQGLAILFIAILARRLGVEAFGQFTWISAVVLIGNTFTNFGTDTYIIREISREGKATPLIAEAFGLQLALSGLWWVVTLLLRPDFPLVIYSLALFPLAIFSVATASLRAFERMDRVWFLSLANGLVQLLAALSAFDLWTLCLFLLVGQILIAALAYWICFATLEGFSLFSFYTVLPLLQATLPFAALTILIVLSQRLGILMVSALLGDTATGLFSSVTRLVDGVKLGHYAVLGALLPVLSRRASGSKQYFRRGFSFLLYGSLGMALAFSILSRIIILVLYGDQYVPAAGLLALLGWSLLPYTVSSFISYDLIALGRESTLVKGTLVSLLLFLVLYFWLVPVYDLYGAVVAALAGESLQALVLLFLRYRSGLRFIPQMR